MATAWIEAPLPVIETPAPPAELLDIDRLGHAFHRDGEPCERAVIVHDCPENHRYGRTWAEAV